METIKALPIYGYHSLPLYYYYYLKNGLLYLCTFHFAISATATVTLFLPAAAVGKLEPSIAASFPNTYDCMWTERSMLSVVATVTLVANYRSKSALAKQESNADYVNLLSE